MKEGHTEHFKGCLLVQVYIVFECLLGILNLDHGNGCIAAFGGDLTRIYNWWGILLMQKYHKGAIKRREVIIQV
jgi:hypothetical protein